MNIDDFGLGDFIMSEKSFSSSKVIQIIVITWILSFVTTIFVVYTAPTFFQKSWHETYRFSGSFNEDGDEYPEIFIESDHWRLSETITRKETGGRAKISIFKPETKLEPIMDYERIENTFTRTSLPIHQAGYHLLRVEGNNCDWEIIIEEYY